MFNDRMVPVQNQSDNMVVVVNPEAIVPEVEVDLQLHKLMTMMTNQLHQHQQIV